MVSLTQWTWAWANSGRQWRTGKPGVLQSMGWWGVGHNLATEQQQGKCTVQKVKSLGTLTLNPWDPWAPDLTLLIFGEWALKSDKPWLSPREAGKIWPFSTLSSLTTQINSIPHSWSQGLSWLMENAGKDIGNFGPLQLVWSFTIWQLKKHWVYIPCYLLLLFGLQYNAFNAYLLLNFGEGL